MKPEELTEVGRLVAARTALKAVKLILASLTQAVATLEKVLG